jgi:hypothetical protein
MGDEKRLDEQLAGVEPSRRTFIKRIAIGAAFATPIITSFSMSGMAANTAAAQSSNLSGNTTDNIDN